MLLYTGDIDLILYELQNNNKDRESTERLKNIKMGAKTTQSKPYLLLNISGRHNTYKKGAEHLLYYLACYFYLSLNVLQQIKNVYSLQSSSLAAKALAR